MSNGSTSRRFILIECHGSAEAHGIDWGIPQWRATSATEKSTIDVFFFAPTMTAAKDHIRSKHPGATFSDEKGGEPDPLAKTL